ncbi:DUF3545 family protein [Catenovulum sediminis]|uniref:DUF3545 family protein n=1 Tax=Catenovulum sediminis TaxID=1740262 RepID=A0ABV1RFI7_9ALTE|nr:DUF3545 family protein [Catenovulum sediminis]
MEMTNEIFFPSTRHSNNESKSSKKRKWREIEAILDQRNLSRELDDIDEFGQLKEHYQLDI